VFTFTSSATFRYESPMTLDGAKFTAVLTKLTLNRYDVRVFDNYFNQVLHAHSPIFKGNYDAAVEQANKYLTQLGFVPA